MRNARAKSVGFFVLALVLGLALGVGINSVLVNAVLNEGIDSLHTYTIRCNLTYIQSGECIAGYVTYWTVPQTIRVLQADVWMGNPYDIKWEGDIFLTTRGDINPWYPSEDEVIIHYQFDSHAPSPLTHFRMFNLRPGFVVEGGHSLFMYRLFNSFDEKPTNSGDGWIRLYYLYE